MAAVGGSLGGCLINSGQTCSATTRLLVPRERLAEDGGPARSRWSPPAPVGDPLDPATQQGPLVSKTQQDRVRGYIRDAVADGARLVVGGADQPSSTPTGYFVEPTVLVAEAGSRIEQEEVFGPVLTVVPYDGGDEAALAIANGTPYGLRWRGVGCLAGARASLRQANAHRAGLHQRRRLQPDGHRSVVSARVATAANSARWASRSSLTSPPSNSEADHMTDTVAPAAAAVTDAEGRSLYMASPPEFETVEEERAHRKAKLAGAFRMFSRAGLDEGVAGHITVRDPAEPDTYWVNPFGMHFSMIRSGDLVRVDEAGRVVEGSRAVNGAAVAIHCAVHAARPDVLAAAHAHGPYGKALSSLDVGIVAADPGCLCVLRRLREFFDDYTGVVLDREEGPPDRGGCPRRPEGDHPAQTTWMLTVGGVRQDKRRLVVPDPRAHGAGAS